MNQVKGLVVLFVVILLLLIGIIKFFPRPIGTPKYSLNSGSGQQQGTEVTAASAVSGDTLKLSDGQSVKLIGLSAPQMGNLSQTPQCYAGEAQLALQNLVAGKTVRLVKDTTDKDSSGNLLRYVFVGNTFINDYLIRNGDSRAYTLPPDTKYSDQFTAAENEARNNLRGLWRACPGSTLSK